MKAIIGYVSMSGNTEEIADILKNVLLLNGCEVDIERLDQIEAETLLSYDCAFIGTYTWGDGDIPYDAEDFFEELNEVHLAGLPVACFGSGERYYPKFCAAVDSFAEKINERGGRVFDKRLKIELSPDSDEELVECQEFAKTVYEWAQLKEVIQNV